jgi:DNA replication protein DnaC
MCDDCKDIGWYRLDVQLGHPQFGKYVRCECKTYEDTERLNRLSGLNATERKIKLDDIVTDGLNATARMVAVCHKFIIKPHGIITIHGGTGNGKTMALQACVNAALSQNIAAVYVTAFDLISFIRSAFMQDKYTKVIDVIDGNAYQRLQRFEHVKVLALDELDKVKVTDWVLEQLTDLIDHRYRLAEDGTGGTLIAMNESLDILPAWISSRLKRYTVIYNSDDDMRPELSQYEMGP